LEDPLGGNLTDQGEYVDHRREHAERAWAASVSDMGPATVIGPQALGEVPAAPASVIDNRPEDERRSPEGVPSTSAPATEPETPDMAEEGVTEPQAAVQEPEPEVSPEPEPEVLPAPEESSTEPHAPEGDVKAPNKASSKVEWVEWAVACGANREEAQEMTRLELITKYAKLRPNER
jgi:hypothetical protein